MALDTCGILSLFVHRSHLRFPHSSSLFELGCLVSVPALAGYSTMSEIPSQSGAVPSSSALDGPQEPERDGDGKDEI